MTVSLTPETFASWPLDRQLRHLAVNLDQADARELLALGASVRDHAPLAWLCVQLLEKGWLRHEPNRHWFARFFIEQPETAVHKVLKSWVTTERNLRAGHRQELVETLLAALTIIPVERLSSMCLIDRFLKHNFTEQRDAYVEAVIEGCSASLRQGRIDNVSVDRLAQVPARAMARLEADAASAGAKLATAFDQQRRELARRVICVLGQAPKAVSQTNAEELLSRRVYTDPGHFLIELLQNAEDSGAVTWRLDFDRGRVVVWHDGTAFDARDVVGVCSIGQTTKRKQQIGFFGVGFKSVYEVTDRPQIYSADYSFEIADVSIPKLLASRPDDLPADGTVLVLPLRDPSDSVRSPAALFAKARDLDPVVLFTLRRIDVIELKLTRSDGHIETHAIREEVDPSRRYSLIRQQPDGWVRKYVVQDDEYAFDLGFREPGRPDRTRVMVGLRLDDLGVPTPLPEGAATVYSYLPTKERSGLRFFVQGHFDVPVDRERITQDSSWNRWILSKVPWQLARLASRSLSGGAPELRREAALGLLSVLPLERELGSPVFRQITQGLAAAMAQQPFLPCTDGGLHRIQETIIAPASLAALFGREPLIDPRTGALGFFLDAGLDERTVEIARSLGCASFDRDALVEMLERWLQGVGEGGRPSPERAPRFLSEPRSEELSELYDLLLHGLEDLERAGRRGAAFSLLAQLRRLPLVLGADGGLHRPAQRSPRGIARGGTALRQIFSDHRPFVQVGLDEDPPRVEVETDEGSSEESGFSRTAVFLERLGVPSLGVQQVVQALEQSLEGVTPPLSGPEALPFPGCAERLDLILSLVAEASYGYQSRVARLPLFPAMDGRLYPLALSLFDRGGLLAVTDGSLGDELRAFYGERRPLAGPDAARGAVAELISRLNVPALGLETLIEDLRDPSGPIDRDLEGLRQLHALLESIRGEIPSRSRGELALLPIWPDSAGRGRPLKGDAAVFIPAYDEVTALFPAAPFLDPAIRGRGHLRDMKIESVGVAAVIDALAPGAVPPLAIEPTPAAVGLVIPFLVSRSERISARSRERMARLPAFLSDRGQVCRLELLSAADGPELRRIYGDFTGRHFVDPESPTMDLIRKLEMEARLIDGSAKTLIADLEMLTGAGEFEGRRPSDDPLPLIGDADHLVRIHRYLAAQAHSLSRDVVQRALGLAIYPDRRGRLGSLGAPGAARGQASAAAPSVCAASDELRDLLEVAGARVLDEEAQERLETLFEAAAAPRAGIEVLLERLDEISGTAGHRPSPLRRSGPAQGLVLADHPVLSDRGRRAKLYSWLLSHQGEAFVSQRCRELLSRSPLFPTERGSLLPAVDLVIDADLPDLGIDWRPHPEIPAALLELLSRHLDVGKPQLDNLTRRHLMPAYLAAVNEGSRDRSGQILNYLARRLEGRSTGEVRQLLSPPSDPIRLEDQQGTFRSAPELLLPSLEIAAVVEAAFGSSYPRPSPTRYPEEMYPFLHKLGVSQQPPLEVVARIMASPLGGSAVHERGLALATLCGHLYQQAPQRVLAELPLKTAAWVVDGSGRWRRPHEIYLPELETRTLIGDFGDLFVDEQIPARLGPALTAKVGFRTERDVTPDEVLRHIEASAGSRTGVPFRIYLWFEAGLSQGWLDGGALSRLVAGRPWISTDDGELRNHREVIGVSALAYFGERRGYWERGSRRCPTLCRTFRIPDDVTPPVVIDFFGDIAGEVRTSGDRRVLENEAALPRMLLNCYELLGDEGQGIDSSLPVILCRQRGDVVSEGQGLLRLVPASEPKLLRSDTPTLERLFEEVGVFYVASLGSVDQRAEVDRFYELMGIRRLRDAYSVTVDQGGIDVSERFAEALGRVRAMMRALLAVIPRLKRQMALLVAESWVEGDRLRPLVERGAVRAIEGLQVVYTLDRIGQVSAEKHAVYDPKSAALLLDSALLGDPSGNALELAVGILPCIYDGQGEDMLVSDVQILLGLTTREGMDAYLDLRHYPRGDEGPRDGRSRLAERLAEVMDYAIDRRLSERFAELRGHDLGTWRDRQVLERVMPDDAPSEGSPYEAAVRRALPLLLDAVEVHNPSSELVETLATILTVGSLAEMPSLLMASLSPESEDELRPFQPRPLPQNRTQGARAIPPPTAGSSAAQDDNRYMDSTSPLFADFLRQLESGAESSFQPGFDAWSRPAPARGAQVSGSTASASGPPAGQARAGASTTSSAPDRFQLKDDPPMSRSTSEPIELPETPPLGTPDGSLWHRFVRFLGLGDEASSDGPAPVFELPGWAGGGANGFSPTSGIAPQLWVTPENLRKVQGQTPAAQLSHSPSVLPPPYRYAVHKLGSVFDHQTQTWRGGSSSLLELSGSGPLGRTVVFQGKLVPGVSQLPVPLFAWTSELPSLIHGDAKALDLMGAGVSDGSLTVKVSGSEPIVIRYEVDLLRVPTLTSAPAPADVPPEYTVPTMSRGELPFEVREWLERQVLMARSPWELAMAVQELVSGRYIYDESFMERPEVQREVRRLQPGRGNHHLQLLHASAGGQVLGRGICYELNILVVELLRHLGVPALVATCWVLEDGAADRPDHLIALALLDSSDGPCLVPLEASTGPQGARHPLGARRSPHQGTATWGLNQRPGIPSVPGLWSGAQVANLPEEASLDQRLEAMRGAEHQRLLVERRLLLRAITLVSTIEGKAPVTQIDGMPVETEEMPFEERIERLRQVATEQLRREELVESLLAVMRGEYSDGLPRLDELLLELIRRGLIQVRQAPTHQLWPADQKGPFG